MGFFISKKKLSKPQSPPAELDDKEFTQAEEPKSEAKPSDDWTNLDGEPAQTTTVVEEEKAFSYKGGVMNELGDAEEEDSNGSIHTTQLNKLNLPSPEALVKANLMQWKAAAEDGPCVIRFFLVLSAVGVLITSVVPYVMDFHVATVRHVTLSVYTFVISIVSIIMDGRGASLGRNPVGVRARIRKSLTKHMNVLEYLWGRGLLSMFSGSLHVIHIMWKWMAISAAFVLASGFLAFAYGCMSSFRWNRMKQSLTDDSFLECMFKARDTDHDEYLDANEFSLFLDDIGVDFDDIYTLKAFKSIQHSRKERVNYEEFLKWWARCKLDEGHNAV